MRYLILILITVLVMSGCSLFDSRSTDNEVYEETGKDFEDEKPKFERIDVIVNGD